MTHTVHVTPTEVNAMADVLARRYGDAARDVAHHFACEHAAIGDNTRAAAWKAVAASLERGSQSRTLS